MAFITKELAEIEADILRDIRNLLAIATIDPDSDFAVRAASTANAIEGLYEHQKWIMRQIFPDSADPDFMALHAAIRNLKYKDATFATGNITLTGAASSAIPVNTELKYNGAAYVTTAAAVVGVGGTVSVPSRASVAGIAGNLDAGQVLTLTDAPPGVSSQATVITMLGGTDRETDVALLARLMYLLQNPPSSGNAPDYKRWAEEVNGVSAAYVFPIRRGLGTTDIFIISADGLPSVEILDATQLHIDQERPCGLNTVDVFAPAEIHQNHVIQVALDGITLAEATSRITSVLNSYYAGVAPGQAYIKSVVEGLITDIPGISDRLVSSPAANVIPTVDSSTVQWCRLGTLAVSLMP